LCKETHGKTPRIMALPIIAEARIDEALVQFRAVPA